MKLASYALLFNILTKGEATWLMDKESDSFGTSDVKGTQKFQMESDQGDSAGDVVQASDNVEHAATSSDGHVACYENEKEESRYYGELYNHDTLGKRKDYCLSECEPNNYAGVSTPSLSLLNETNFYCTCYTDFDFPEKFIDHRECNDVDRNVDGMDIFVRSVAPVTCETNVKDIRKQIVGEDNMPYGYNIVTGERKYVAPFDLISEGCHTNMYNLHTYYSGSSSEASISTKTVSDYASSERSDISSRVEASIHATLNLVFRKLTASASLSASTKISNVYESSGSQTEDSRVITSEKVTTVARISMKEYEGSFRFGTLSKQFMNVLKNWKKKDFNKAYGRTAILNIYGTHVMTHAIYGGFIKTRQTMSASDFSEYNGSSERAQDCIGGSLAAEFDLLGSSVGGSFDYSKCSTKQKQTTVSSRNVYKSDIKEVESQGGKVVEDKFKVDFDTAVPIIDQGVLKDNPLKFRVLSDFVFPQKLHPKQLKFHQTTPDELNEIQEKLEELILTYLRDANKLLEGKCAGAPYLKVVNDILESFCHIEVPRHEYVKCAEGNCNGRGECKVLPNLDFTSTIDKYYDDNGSCICFDDNEGEKCTTPSHTVLMNSFKVSNWESRSNYDRHFIYDQGGVGAISAIRSHFSRKHDDRSFDFKNSRMEGVGHYSKTKTYRSAADHKPFNMECPKHYFVYLLDSDHSNYWEDRRWRVLCAEHKYYKWSNNGCLWTSKHIVEKDFSFSCDLSGKNYVIAGIRSERYSTYYNDRIYAVKCCPLDRVLDPVKLL